MSSDSTAWWQIERNIQTLSDWHLLKGRPEAPLLSTVDLNAPSAVRMAREELFALTAADVRADAPADTAASRIDRVIRCFDGREIDIMRHRIFADVPATLDTFGTRLGVTRERVRQIETRIYKALGDSPIVRSIALLTSSALADSEHVTALSTTLGEIPALSETVMSVGQPLWRLLDRLDDSFEIVDGWWCQSTVRLSMTRTRNELTEVAAGRRYLPISETSFGSQPWAFDWLAYCGIATQGNYALLASSGVAERAAVVLEISGSPMPLEAIAAAIDGDRSERSIRNALAEDDRFTRVDRTSWAMANWGLESYQSIRTLIANELDRNDGSIRLSKLVSTLTERFTISSSSIITYAGGLPFATVDGMVEYATSSIVVPKRSAAETRRLFRVGDKWLLRLQLSSDHVRGSGSVLPSSLIPILGISYGESVSRPCRLGDQRFAWNGSQLTLGSIKRFVDEDGLTLGDTCFAVFGDSGDFDLVKVLVPSEPARLRASTLAGLTIVGSEDLADVARSVGRPETSSPSQVAEALRARGDYEVADAVAAAQW